jgi:hypothetical protein
VRRRPRYIVGAVLEQATPVSAQLEHEHDRDRSARMPAQLEMPVLGEAVLERKERA